ncbi:UNVERIFIED_CONTAM: hypothetical protein PYX00_011028 [Menopon gallinae]|uniref:Sm protein F n=1 Tax=Menopon gallinae TaxID=328185 RepID=A0AAW2H6C6_9NEOP
MDSQVGAEDKDRRPEFENPKQFLLRKVNRKVEVVLKWGQSYEGVLVCTDDYFNILLEHAVEKIDGTVAGDVGKILIRCNNIFLVKDVES